jgi:transposase
VKKIIRTGMDTSKSVFQLHGVDIEEQPVLCRKLTRKAMIAFFEKSPPMAVGIEACGGSHHWGRLLTALGHQVKVLPPHYVKAYVKRGKHDAADAAAICEAMSRPTMRTVPVKSIEQQAGQMLINTRDRLIRQRTQLMNTIRGHASEFGLVAAKGIKHINPLLARAAADETLPLLARELFADHGAEFAHLQIRLAEIEKRLMTLHRQNEVSRRLAQVPTLGPIGATMLAIKVSDAKAFRSGRDFAAWLGLTPKNHSTAGKTKLGAITRAGDEMLRSVLVVGATAVIQQARRGRGHPMPWLDALLKRKPPKLAAVALANKTARIAWKLLVSGETYNPNRRSQTLSAAA